ncbi:MrcB family domain-containing protein [Thalassobaculum litoreum]|uniref:5-methylcytosine-specific restriction enzyme A n=1 Tax=Thalassobaculum litoreum DSM 18839 TaxID=1123362 RepID=A0A8G2BPM5_9PROT|nr:DUF3578 domain-containing protein [Thalassobaculum litoreum]SDG57639.1 5-methylcytosine-specific restriction enzyme A [Thalassobaculum litoreum DSM 18839]
MLHETLKRIADEYGTARTETFEKNPLAHFIRHDAPRALSETLNQSDLLYSSGVGPAGRWALIPWIAALHPLVTTSAQFGYYVVYLFAEDMSVVYLSLQHATTELEAEFGTGKKRRDELARRAAVMRSRLSGDLGTMTLEAIDLRSDGAFATNYENGHACGVRYETASLPAETKLADDLREMIELYRTLIYRGGPDDLTSSDHTDADSTIKSITHIRQARLHYKLELSGSYAKKVKAVHGYVCQVCDFDFEKTYGEIGKGFIEAHHLVPVATLNPGHVATMNPRTDFAVLCSNCHRMVHKTNPPMTIDELKKLIE